MNKLNYSNEVNLNNLTDEPDFAINEIPQLILENNTNKGVVEINEGVGFQDKTKESIFNGENFNYNYYNYSKNDNNNNFKENLIIPKFPNESSQIYVRPRENNKKCRFYTAISIIMILIIFGFLYLFFFTSFFSLKVIFLIDTYFTEFVKPENYRILDTLSKLEINCPEGQILTSFKLKSTPSHQYYYYYTCGRSPFNFFDNLIEKHSTTTHFDENFENEIDVLSRIGIHCSNNSAINRFKLIYDKNKKNTFYSYSCLEFERKPKLYLKCFDQRSDYCYSSNFDESINILVDMKSGDELDSIRFLNSFKLDFDNGLFGTKAYYYSMKTCEIFN